MKESFDEFLAKRGYIRGYKHEYQVAYDYGAASRQEEISKLQAEIDELRKRLAEYEREGYKLVPVEPLIPNSVELKL